MINNKAQGEKPRHTGRFWILGAGRFGQIAISRISRHFPKARLTVVDRCRRSTSISAETVTVVRADAVPWLVRNLTVDRAVDWLVPAVPEHVATGWLSAHLERDYRLKKLAIPDRWLAELPHAMEGQCGQAFVSHAEFICPDNCLEPKNRCTHTGKPRPLDMFRLLNRLDLDNIVPIVLRSYQLLPGVGGIQPADLWRALDAARDNIKRPLMVATACRCHGVVDFFCPA